MKLIAESDALTFRRMAVNREPRMIICSIHGCMEKWETWWDNDDNAAPLCDEHREEAVREDERLRVAIQNEAAGAVRLHIRENQREALLAAQVPAQYAGFTHSSWEERYGIWPGRSTPQGPDLTTTEFLGEMTDWPVGWTSDSGWGQPERTLDWAVVLYGDVGARKTGLATAVAVNAMGCGRVLPGDVLYIDMCTWLRCLKRDKFENYDEVWWAAAHAKMLIFDDVGAVHGNKLSLLEMGLKPGWWQAEVAELIRYRHMWAKPTVFTSNGTLQAMGAIDASILSRISVRLQWRCEGEDHRIQNRAEI